MGAGRRLDVLVMEDRWDESRGADNNAPFWDNNSPWGETSVEFNCKIRGIVALKAKLGGVWALEVPRSMTGKRRVGSIWSNMID